MSFFIVCIFLDQGMPRQWLMVYRFSPIQEWQCNYTAVTVHFQRFDTVFLSQKICFREISVNPGRDVSSNLFFMTTYLSFLEYI